MQSWVSDKLVVKTSRKHGLGLFSRIPLEPNELIIVFGGYIDTKPSFDGYFLEVIPGFYLNNSLTNPKEDVSNFLNHSCDPNAEIRNIICVHTMGNILVSNEITIDYFKGHDLAKFPDFRCQCGSPHCKFKP